MDRDPVVKRKTSISYKTEEKTVMRGYNLSDLAEEGYSFYDAMFVLFQDRIPTEKEEKMLKYEMGVFLEHSMSPSAVGAIGVSAGRPNLPVCVAAAVSTFGGVHGHEEDLLDRMVPECRDPKVLVVYRGAYWLVTRGRKRPRGASIRRPAQ